MSILQRIRRILSRPEIIRQAVVVRMDAWKFRRKFREFAKGKERENPARRVLVVSLGQHPAYPKIECMLLKALQLKGCTPVVLTYHWCKQVEPYFRAFGVEHFLYFDDFMKEAADPTDEATLDGLFAHPTFHALLAFSRGGVDHGRHALSAVVRKMQNKGVAFADPAMQTTLRRSFAESLVSGRAALKLFRSGAFEAVLFSHEKGYTPYGDIFSAATAEGLNVVSIAHSQRPDAYVLKRYGLENRTMHHSSLSPRSWETVKAMPWDDRKEEAFMRELHDSYEKGTWFHRNVFLAEKKIITPEDAKRALGLDPQKKTATVFSHILWDATFFFGTGLFQDYEHWLVETVKVACANDRVNWLIKLHPDYTWKNRGGETPRDVLALQMNLGALPSHVQVVPAETPISTYSFFQITDYAVTVRGTVGIEAPCFGIPTFTAGTGRYSHLGFTIDSDTPEQYLSHMARIHETPPMSDVQRTLARKHAYALFKMRVLPFGLFQLKRASADKLGKGMNHDTEIRARTVEDIERDPALRAFASWVLDAKDEDFLREVTD